MTLQAVARVVGTFAVCGILLGALAAVGCVASSADDGEPHFTDAQLVAGLNERENQAWSYWLGGPTGSIGPVSSGEADSSEFGGGGLNIGYGSGMLLYAAEQKAGTDPELFLPTLQSRDPEVVLTGLYLLSRTTPSGRVGTTRLAAIGDVVRRDCLHYQDVRIRWYGLSWLIDNKQVNDADAAVALSDGDFAVQFLGTRALDVTSERNSDSLASRDPHIREAAVATKSRLVGLLFDHLADSNWIMRFEMAMMLPDVVFAGTQWNQCNLPKGAPALPSVDSYILVDHQDCLNTQSAWKTWWSANSATMLPVSSR
jgi:hypothetical protein